MTLTGRWEIQCIAMETVADISVPNFCHLYLSMLSFHGLKHLFVFRNFSKGPLEQFGTKFVDFDRIDLVVLYIFFHDI